MLYKRFLPLMVALSAVVAAGCGTDNSPVSTGDESAVYGGTTFLAFSPEAAQRAGKTTTIPPEGRAVSRWFNHEGGRLVVRDPNLPGPQDDLGVFFTVPQGGLAADAEVLITMTVFGNSLSELVVAFEPSGLVFNQWAELVFGLGALKVDMPLEGLVAYHIHGDGTVEILPVEVFHMNDAHLGIRIPVPGFSRYSMGGGD